MRRLNEEELKKVYFAEDMLKGNINRMCTTHEVSEFVINYNHALDYINQIRSINVKRLFEKGGEKV